MKKTFLIICLAVVCLSGCGQQASETKQQGETGNADVQPKQWEDLDEDKMHKNDMGETFKDPFTLEGDLFYTIDQCSVCQNINQCALKAEDFCDPYNVYSIDEVGRGYTKVSDYIKEDGSIDEKHQLVLLDITVKNKNAIGPIKKNEFSIYNISLVGGSPNNYYYAAYFSEAGKTGDSEQPFYFELKQGQEVKVQLGFFVLREDLDQKDVKGFIGTELFDINL